MQVPVLNRKTSPITRRAVLGVIVVILGTFGGLFAQSAPAKGPKVVHSFAQPLTAPKGITPDSVAKGVATMVGPLNSNQKLRLVIALAPPKLAEEAKFVEALRTKGTPEYGKFLTADQWNARFAPSAASEQAVVDWATSQGLTVTSRFPNRLLVDVEGSAAAIEQAFGLKLNNYMVEGKQRFSSDRDPVLPAHLLGVVQNVQGLNNMRALHPLRKNAVVPEYPMYTPGPAVGKPTVKQANATSKPPASISGKPRIKSSISNGSYDPTDIYSSQAYDVGALYGQSHCCNPFGNSGGSPIETTIAIATAGAQDWADIAGFQSNYSYLAYHMAQIPVDGTTVPCDPTNATCDSEGTMDAEWSMAMSNSFGSLFDTSTVLMYDGVDAGFGTFSDIYNRILSDNSSRVMSTSWGCQEGPSCYDQTDMNTVDAIFMQMTGQGWTLVGASGDQGATAGCGDALAVQFPTADPNMVAAGGTTMYLDSNGNFVSQSAWSGGPDGCGSNDGGSTGGESQYWAVPGYQSGLGLSGRGVPDLALNADWFNTPQNLYFGGFLQGNGGTSIVAPEIAGIFAQFNSYLLTLGNNCLNEGGPCAPMGGLLNPMVYYLALNPGYAAHYPFYDITSGCNNNDVTTFYDLGYYCAVTGWDHVTGWGSFNALQLAWGINTYRAGDFGNPNISFSGPATSHWYNTDQIVSWSVADVSGISGYSPNGIAGFTQQWDSDPGDVFSESTPGSGNSFYSGPQYPKATSGCLDFTGGSCAGSSGQGMHTVYVRAWDNSGFTSVAAYGPIGFDSIAPVTTASLSGPSTGGKFTGAVKVTLNKSDNASGVNSTVYKVDAGSFTNYSGPFTVPAVLGTHTVQFHSTDVAGNVEGTETKSFSIESPTSASLTSSLNPSVFGQNVTFKATVHASTGGTPTGTVTFKSGATVLGTANLAAGVASFTTHALAAGSDPITGVYNGSTKDIAATTPVLAQKVNKAGTTGKLTVAVNPTSYHQIVKLTATIKSNTTGTPSGTVLFKDGATTLGSGPLNTSGVANFTTLTLAVGVHHITVVYNGNADFTASTSPALTQTVKKSASTTTLTSSANPSKVGKPVTFTATVTPAFGGVPAGTVTFKDGATTIGSGTLNPTHQAKLTTTTLAAGTHHITAVYGGNVNYNTSTSASLAQVVNH
jgi:Pro-kumamolisin, activation domain/Bacterial Ig-like domain (group 3)